jgi:hypothetical protein
MSENYSEQETERARMAERSSAGMATQHLNLPTDGGPGAGSLPSTQQRPNITGLALVAIGAMMLLMRLGSMSLEITGGMVLLTIASVFYFFGFWRHIYGLIIPASILAGLSVGVTFADLTDGVSVLWGLALGFLTIYVLGGAMFGQRSMWPVIPAVILFAVGIIVAVANLPAFFAASMAWVPLLLIGAGVYLGWSRRA